MISNIQGGNLDMLILSPERLMSNVPWVVRARKTIFNKLYMDKL